MKKLLIFLIALPLFLACSTSNNGNDDYGGGNNQAKVALHLVNNY